MFERKKKNPPSPIKFDVIARVGTRFYCSGQGGLDNMPRREIADGDAKGWVVLLANFAGSRIDVFVEECLNSLYSALGVEGKGRELEKGC